jgi:hypothetical protein
MQPCVMQMVLTLLISCYGSPLSPSLLSFTFLVRERGWREAIVVYAFNNEIRTK